MLTPIVKALLRFGVYVIFRRVRGSSASVTGHACIVRYDTVDAMDMAARFTKERAANKREICRRLLLWATALQATLPVAA